MYDKPRLGGVVSRDHLPYHMSHMHLKTLIGIPSEITAVQQCKWSSEMFSFRKLRSCRNCFLCTSALHNRTFQLVGAVHYRYISHILAAGEQCRGITPPARHLRSISIIAPQPWWLRTAMSVSGRWRRLTSPHALVPPLSAAPPVRLQL